MEIKTSCRCTAIEGVAEDGKAAAGQVDADLVSAAGVEGAFYEEARTAFYGDFFEDVEIGMRVLTSTTFRELSPLALLGFAGNAIHVHFNRKV